MSNLKFKSGKDTNSPNKKPTCAKCGKGHLGVCLVGTRNRFNCGNSGHKMGDGPNFEGSREGWSSLISGSSDSPKKNRFYALRSRGEQGTSPDVVTGMFKVFSIYVYDLLDPSATLSFVTLAKKFDFTRYLA